MTGERHYAKEHERARMASLRERREFERLERLNAQDAQLAEHARFVAEPPPCVVCGDENDSKFAMCDDCWNEIGGES